MNEHIYFNLIQQLKELTFLYFKNNRRYFYNSPICSIFLETEDDFEKEILLNYTLTDKNNAFDNYFIALENKLIMKEDLPIKSSLIFGGNLVRIPLKDIVTIMLNEHNFTKEQFSYCYHVFFPIDELNRLEEREELPDIIDNVLFSKQNDTNNNGKLQFLYFMQCVQHSIDDFSMICKILSIFNKYDFSDYLDDSIIAFSHLIN